MLYLSLYIDLRNTGVKKYGVHSHPNWFFSHTCQSKQTLLLHISLLTARHQIADLIDISRVKKAHLFCSTFRATSLIVCSARVVMHINHSYLLMYWLECEWPKGVMLVCF